MKKLKSFIDMNKTYLSLLMILCLLPVFLKAQITTQPVNFSICSNNSNGSAIFYVVCDTPTMAFQWQSKSLSGQVWDTINDSMPDFTGWDNDTLTIAKAVDHIDYEFRCVVSDYFTHISADTSDTVKISLLTPPQPGFTYLYPCEKTSVEFHDTSSPCGSIAEWVWDFGDSSISITQNPKHYYLSSGEKTVNLTVTDSNGCSDSFSKTIFIKPYNYDLEIQGPLVVCSNQSSQRTNDLFILKNNDSSCSYTWEIVPTVFDTTKDTLNTLWIHWSTVNKSTQVMISITETDTNGCETGYVTKEVLLTTQVAPDQGEIIRKNTKDVNRGILIFIGKKASSYTWGYTDNDDPDNETINQMYHSGYCDFGTLNLDKYTYWVETSNETRLACSTRTIYKPETKNGSDLETNDHMIIMPNPAHSNEIEIELKASVNDQYQYLRILSVTGQVLKEWHYHINAKQTIDITGLTPGLYFIVAGCDDGRLLVEKLMVQQ